MNYPKCKLQCGKKENSTCPSFNDYCGICLLASKEKGDPDLNLEDYDSETLTMDGYNDCIVGIIEQFGRPPIVCYSKTKVINKLVNGGITNDEAEEFFYYNQLGSGMGEYTPCFLTEGKIYD